MINQKEFNEFLDYLVLYTRAPIVDSSKLKLYEDFALQNPENSYKYLYRILEYSTDKLINNIQKLEDKCCEDPNFAWYLAKDSFKFKQINKEKCLFAILNNKDINPNYLKEWSEEIANNLMDDIPESIQLIIASYIDRPTKYITSSRAIDKWYNAYKMRIACE